jgi:hypothetical protein
MAPFFCKRGLWRRAYIRQNDFLLETMKGNVKRVAMSGEMGFRDVSADPIQRAAVVTIQC